MFRNSVDDSQMSITRRTRDLENMTDLSPTQAEVTAVHEAGYDRETIGAQLQIEPETVDSYLNRIRIKTDRASNTWQECRYAFGGTFFRRSNIPSNFNTWTGAIVYYDPEDLVFERFVLPAIREKHGHENVEEVPLTRSMYQSGAVFRSLPVDEVPKVAFLEDGELVETVDARDSRAVNCELLNYLTVDQDPVVRARLGLEDEEPAESYQQL